jgi:hypothetical protein
LNFFYIIDNIIYTYILIKYFLNMWAGPNTGPKTDGLALAQKGWAELGPTYCFFKFGDGLDPAQTTRLG